MSQTPPKQGVAQQAWHLSLCNYQLLSILEAMCSYTLGDLEHLLDALDATSAFTIAIMSLEPVQAIDPSGQIRGWLDACQIKAASDGAIGRRLQQGATIGPRAGGGQFGTAAPQLASACKALVAAIEEHDASIRAKQPRVRQHVQQQPRLQASIGIPSAIL